METAFLIVSYLSLHFPVGVYINTETRYKRLKSYNKHHHYNIENKIFRDSVINSSSAFLLAIIGSIGIALFPLFALLDFHWIWLVLINILFSLMGSNILASFSLSRSSIYSKSTLRSITYLFLTLGILTYLIQYFIYD